MANAASFAARSFFAAGGSFAATAAFFASTTTLLSFRPCWISASSALCGLAVPLPAGGGGSARSAALRAARLPRLLPCAAVPSARVEPVGGVCDEKQQREEEESARPPFSSFAKACIYTCFSYGSG